MAGACGNTPDRASESHRSMSHNATPAHESAGTSDEPSPDIRGPIDELDPDGQPTGATYFQCRRCGREAMRHRDLVDFCGCY